MSSNWQNEHHLCLYYMLHSTDQTLNFIHQLWHFCVRAIGCMCNQSSHHGTSWADDCYIDSWLDCSCAIKKRICLRAQMLAFVWAGCSLHTVYGAAVWAVAMLLSSWAARCILWMYIIALHSPHVPLSSWDRGQQLKRPQGLNPFFGEYSGLLCMCKPLAPGKL